MARQLLTRGQPRLCWRLQGSGAVVQHRGQVPEGQAAIGGRTAQEQSPGRRGKVAGSVGATEGNKGAQGPRQSHHAALSPPLVGRLVCKGVDLEDTALVVEGFSQELQPPPRVLQMKEPGGGGVSSEPILDSPSSYLPALSPMLLPHCSVTTGCSHKGAEVRRVELTHCQAHVSAEVTARQAEPCLTHPRPCPAAPITWSLGPP